MAKIGHSDSAAAVLVLVGRADSAAGGPDVLTLLAGRVEQLVVRQHEMRAVGHEHAAGGVDPALRELVELAEEGLGLEHHPVAHHAGDVGMQNARRDLAQDEVGVADHDGVAGVGAALVADHEVGPLGEHVDQLPLPFVAPLGTYDNDAGGPAVKHGVSPDRPTKKSPPRGLQNPRANVCAREPTVNSPRPPGRHVSRCRARGRQLCRRACG